MDLEIHTARLMMRPARVDDAEPLLAEYNRWGVVQWLAEADWPTPLERAREFHASACNLPGVEYFVVALGAVLIGAISAQFLLRGNGRSTPGWHLGYWLGMDFHGKGFMSEALGGFLEVLLFAKGLPSVYSGVFVGNPASLHVQEKLGFVVDGGHEVYSVPQKQPLPYLDTVLTPQAFLKRRR